MRRRWMRCVHARGARPLRRDGRRRRRRAAARSPGPAHASARSAAAPEPSRVAAVGESSRGSMRSLCPAWSGVLERSDNLLRLIGSRPEHWRQSFGLERRKVCARCTVALRLPDRVDGRLLTRDTLNGHCLNGSGIRKLALLTALPHNRGRARGGDRHHDARGQYPSVVDSITQVATPSDERGS
jgi:hypothetical protein